jgi:arginine utilization protein RocB
MPKIVHYTESVQGRVSPTIKLKIEKYKQKYRVTEGETIRRALENFLHNVTAKQIPKKEIILNKGDKE